MIDRLYVAQNIVWIEPYLEWLFSSPPHYRDVIWGILSPHAEAAEEASTNDHESDGPSAESNNNDTDEPVEERLD